MSEPVKPRRAYTSPVREERARANREAILQAARRGFLSDGYQRTSIAAIAKEAGVSEDLVYVHFTNKRRLLVEVFNYAVTGDAQTPKVLTQQRPQAVRDERDQRTQIAMFAHDIARRIDRTRPIDDVMRAAAEVDDEIAERHHKMHTTRLANLTQFVSWVAANGPLREGLSQEEAAATVWALAGPDTHRALVGGLGWDVERYAEWLRQTLEAALLPPSIDGARPAH